MKIQRNCPSFLLVLAVSMLFFLPPGIAAEPGGITLAMGEGTDVVEELPDYTIRFVDNKDGTVLDNASGLIWLKNADKFNVCKWDSAIDLCKKLSDDGKDLTDGSKPGEWRLPTQKEFMSLIHPDYHNPAISNDAGTGKWKQGKSSSFINVRSAYYWTSSAGRDSGGIAYIGLAYGDVRFGYNTFEYHVWPVKGVMRTK